MTERLTFDKCRFLLHAWRGRGDGYAPKTLELFRELDDAQRRSREKVDLDREYVSIRARVNKDFAPSAAEREIETLERTAIATRKQARLADLQAAEHEHAIVPTFTAELTAAWPAMGDEFAATLLDFTSAAKSLPAQVADSKAAEARGQQVAHAWHLASGAANTIRALWTISRDLREVGILPTIPAAPVEAWQWTEPSQVPSARSRHYVDFLRDAVARGAGPALVSFDELKARVQVQAAEAAKERAAQYRPSGSPTRARSVLDETDEVNAAVGRAEGRVVMVP